jgi:hypothetical protein
MKWVDAFSRAVGTISGGKKMKSSLIWAALFLTWTLSSCGPEDTKEERKQAEDDAYAEMLKVDDQRACNKSGRLYDNKARECTTYGLSTWECSVTGLRGRLAKDGSGNKDGFVTEVESQVRDGYQLNQCGENIDRALLMVLVKEEKTDRQTIVTIDTRAFQTQTAVALD